MEQQTKSAEKPKADKEVLKQKIADKERAVTDKKIIKK